MARSKERTAVIRAFRRYRKLGFDRDDTRDPFLTLEQMRGVSRRRSDALDLLAVRETLRFLRLSGRGEEEAVRAVFFDLSLNLRVKNEMTYAVRRFALSHHYDERSVYRMLAKAERVFLTVRYKEEAE